MVDFSSERYIGSTGHMYSRYQQRGYSEDADRKTRTREPSVWKSNALASDKKSTAGE